jgi:hypothetical protein
MLPWKLILERNCSYCYQNKHMTCVLWPLCIIFWPFLVIQNAQCKTFLGFGCYTIKNKGSVTDIRKIKLNASIKPKYWLPQQKYSMDPILSQLHIFFSVKQHVILQNTTKYLTATQRTHFCILSVDLWDISYSSTQDIHRNIITILVLPVGSFIASTLHLGFAVRYNHIIIILARKLEFKMCLLYLVYNESDYMQKENKYLTESAIHIPRYILRRLSGR